MLPFIILLAVPIAIAPFVGNIKINRFRLNTLPLFLFFLMLTILVMLRHKDIGNDTSNYIHFFEQFSNMSWEQIFKSSLETGYAVVNKLISLIWDEPHFFIAVMGLTVSVMLYPTYRRLCVDPALTIVLFCSLSTFLMLFSGIRQILAVGIGVIAYEFTRKRKFIWFIVAVVLAVLMHTSAFMLIFMYPLYHLKITKNWLFLVIPSLIVLFIFNKQVFGVLGKFIEQYTNYDAKAVATGAYTMLILFVIFAVYSFLIPDDSLMDEETFALRNFLLISLAVQMFAPLNPLAMRMNYYYIIFLPLLIPRIIQCSRIRYKTVALISRYVMLVVFLAYFFISIREGSQMHIVPYHFFWEYYVI